MDKIFEELNPAQQEAVEYVEGPLLILAGAGSGKTRVLTHRVAYLIERCGVDPYHILAITFTNKAAGEMRARIQGLIGPVAARMWACTFHSACAQILRRDAHALGYKSGFAIYDEDDSRRLVQACSKDLNLDPKKFTPRSIKAKISAAKNELIDIDTFASQASGYAEEMVADVYRMYQKRLVDNNAMDFDDLLVNTVHLLSLFSEVRERYEDRFQFILIDEYQDTNHAQYELVRLLTNRHRNLCAVGDDDQSIYKFRGADIRNILDFESDYPETKVIKLEQNYRSTKTILDIANSVIRFNSQRKPKTLWTENDLGERACVFRSDSEHGEAYFICNTITELLKSGDFGFQDIAIFYRTNAQSRVFEDVFIREGIPYRIVGGIRFYERAEIKDVLAYMRVLANPLDSLSLKRIINRPKRGIGETTVARVERFAALNRISFWDALARAGEAPQVSNTAAKKLTDFVSLVTHLQSIAQSSRLDVLVEAILERTGMMAELRAENTIESLGRMENLREFVAVAQEFIAGYPDSGLYEFLEMIALIADIDSYDEGESAVTLMTLHNAKGLEFPVVFLAGMEEGVFPHFRSIGESVQLEEERRLFYVGVTRAQKRLYLTHAICRDLYGITNHNQVSRFLNEVPSELLDEANSESMPVYFGDDVMLEFEVGDAVKHAKFGSGRIKAVTSPGEVIVTFDRSGDRKLLLAYAKLGKA